MPSSRRAGCFNFFAAVFTGLSILSIVWVVAIAMQPYGRLNPFPPSTLVAAVTLPTAMSTSAMSTSVVNTEATVAPGVEPTGTPGTPTSVWTETPTATVQNPLTPALPVETATMQLTVTRSLTSTQRMSLTLAPTLTPAPSPTRSAFTYTAGITYLVHPVQVCDWMGVGGTVMDLTGKSALGAFVHIWGLGNVDQLVAVGGNPSYGPSGWELRLARAQIVGSWTVQLVASPESRTPLSDAYMISMPGDCKRNLALVRFQQNH